MKIFKQAISKIMRGKKGFSLIETMITIAIIAVVTTVSVTSYMVAIRKGRDARKKMDLHEIESAMEQYYNSCNFTYPTIVSGQTLSQIYCVANNTVIMPKVPVDPRGTPYICPAATTCSSAGYAICSKLEENNSDYCVTSRQGDVPYVPVPTPTITPVPLPPSLHP